MNLKFRRALGAATALIALGIGLSEAMARTNRALLVGVTKYDNLPENDWLAGPANDAELVRDYLAANPVSPFAQENITLVASGVEGSERPTRAAVLKAFSDLAEKAEPGDFVYIQLSGHGSQQPAADRNTETDGADEIFLTADVGKVDMDTKKVPNAILDDEIGAALDAIRDKGAFVWLVVDACHSGTATRALVSNPQEKERKISGASLGITPDMFPAGEATRGGGGSEPERQNALGLTEKDGAAEGKRGGMVAFFAAQTIETTPEMPQPDPTSKTFGLFTYTMMGRLGENPFVSYRQLSQAILQEYSATSRIKPTPMFEGDLDAPVFGMEPGDAVLQWKVGLKDGVVTLPAGRINQVEPGSKLAILPGPQSSMDDAIGYLDVRSATNFSSQLAPAAWRGRAALAPDAIPEGAFARIAERSVNFELTVARPPAGDEAGKINAALDVIAADGKTPVKLKLVEAGQPADLRLFVASEAAVAQQMSEQGQGDAIAASERAALSNEPMLWLLPPSSEITLRQGFRAPQIALVDAGRLREGLADNLVIISKAANLSRLAAVSDTGIRDVSVEFLIQRDGASEDEFEVIEPGKVPILNPEDSVFVRAANKSRGAVDLNVIHIGSDYTISVAQRASRLQKGDEQAPTGLFTVDGLGTSYGNERMIVILTEAKGSTTLDLSYLASKGVRQKTRSSDAPDGFAGLLDDIAKAPETRQMKDFQDKRATKGAVLVFPIETKPSE